ncbi:MAG: hypothetical protein WC998_09520 [Candidatus Paceibacterota bacterium]|jgi:hypothetical protein
MNDLMDVKIVKDIPETVPNKKVQREKWAERIRRIKIQFYNELFPCAGDKIKIYNWRNDSVEAEIPEFIFVIVILDPYFPTDNPYYLTLEYKLDATYYGANNFPICTADANKDGVGIAVFNSNSLRWEDAEL